MCLIFAKLCLQISKLSKRLRIVLRKTCSVCLFLFLFHLAYAPVGLRDLYLQCKKCSLKEKQFSHFEIIAKPFSVQEKKFISFIFCVMGKLFLSLDTKMSHLSFLRY